MLLEMNLRISHLELHLKRQDDIATHRQNLIYQWCAPAAYKSFVETAEIDIPDDLKQFFPD